jgi:hypothetical protein
MVFATICDIFTFLAGNLFLNIITQKLQTCSDYHPTKMDFWNKSGSCNLDSSKQRFRAWGVL